MVTFGVCCAEDMDLDMAVAACMTRDPITIQKE
jgi:hypothetical protein